MSAPTPASLDSAQNRRPEPVAITPILVINHIDGGCVILPPTLLVSLDLEQFAEDAAGSVARIAIILIVAFVAVWLIERFINPVIRIAISEQMEGQPEVEIKKRITTLSHVVYRTLLVVVMAVVIITILPEFGINAAALIAGLGLFGLAVGFGAQNLVKDVINGAFILAENQYSESDVVTLGGVTGVVQDINLRRTVLRDLDGTVHFISHSTIDVVSNWTKTYSRVHMDVGVAYDSDLDHVIAVINRVGQEMAEEPAYKEKILDAPHVLRVDNFGDSSIDIKIIGETAPIEQWAIMGELRLRLKKAFDQEGIEIPFPQRTLHMAPSVNDSLEKLRVAAADGSSVPEQSGGGQAGDVRLDDDSSDGGEGEP